MLVKLSHLGILSVSGMDAKKLLQGQLTCHLDEINEQNGSRGALCNPKGRIISFFYLSYKNNQYFLIMPLNMVAITLSELKKYAQFYKAALNDVSADFYLYGQKTNLNDDIFSKQDIFLTIPWSSSREIKIISSNHSLPINENSIWKFYDIQDYLPAIYPETSKLFLPHDLDLPNLGAISFNKGCYTGQEIIARMHYRGKLKHHLYRGQVQMGNSIVPGQLIYSNKTPCGTIIDVCQYDNSYHILFMTDQEQPENQPLFLSEQQAVITYERNQRGIYDA